MCPCRRCWCSGVLGAVEVSGLGSVLPAGALHRSGWNLAHGILLDGKWCGLGKSGSSGAWDL